MPLPPRDFSINARVQEDHAAYGIQPNPRQ